MRVRRRRVRGVTLIETLMAAIITGLTLTTGVSLLIVGLLGWYRGQGQIKAEEDSHTALRIAISELRQAMSVSVDANGLGISYYLPEQDNTGTDLVPETSDGVLRRIELDGSTFNMIANGNTRTLCTDVTLTDPNSSEAYKVFTPGAGTTTLAVTIEIVTKDQASSGDIEESRNRETVFVRNVPPLVNQ